MQARKRLLRTRALGALGAVALVLGAVPVVAPRPASAAGPVRVMQFNFCGAICNKGVVDRAGSNNDVVEDIRNRIVSSRPDLVFLNEACHNQFGRLKKLLAGSSWRMNGVFRAQRHDSRCKGGFGDAVLTAGGMGGARVLELPDLGSEHRAVLCLRTNARGSVLACALHLVTKDPEKARQLAAATKQLNAAARGGAVVVGGDFNVQPNRMPALIDGARGGEFFDVDPQKAPTRGQKIDFVLFSRDHFSSPSGGPAKSKYSDHRVLSGQATRR
jgi:endonuclease/exonuclease/phosphatase family metal-dependent hydrolase